ncbi:MAG: pyruvate formate lyase family protein [Planctomycetota bacterium]
MVLVEAQSLQASTGQPWPIRRAGLVHDRMAARRFAIDPQDLLVGRCLTVVPPETALGPEEAERICAAHAWPGGMTGHCALDLDVVLAQGIDGLLARIAERQQAVVTEAEDVTLQAFRIALDGLQRMIDRASEACEQALISADTRRAAELRIMADSCRHLRHAAPRSMREALQLFLFIWLGCSWNDNAGCIAPAHLDRWLAPFYEQDLAAGRIDRDAALALIVSLYFLINASWPRGSAIPVMVGGRDGAGRTVCNELSRLCLEALRHTHLVYPTVGLCWHPDLDEDLLQLAVDLVAEGHSTPAFFGDDTIQRGLRDLGLPPAEAADYINSACVEITPVGSSGVWVASPYISVCAVLDEEISAQAAGQAAADFDGFLLRYLQRLEHALSDGLAEIDRQRARRRQQGGHPLQSAFTRDCIARARDVDDGGARHDWIEPSFVGLANLVDSLVCIRALVFTQRGLDLPGLRRLLDSDFTDDPSVQASIMSLPKYGQDDPDVDALLGRIIAHLQCCCVTLRAKDGARVIPGAFCWTMHERLGAHCGATPDGRRAGSPFADGCGPAQGRETRGPTAAILSTTSWDHSPMIGGLAYNMKFSRTLLRDRAGRTALTGLIRTFLARGGFETQINVVDQEQLLRARERPEDHADLVVRIGGYTDYFTRLSPAM